MIRKLKPKRRRLLFLLAGISILAMGLTLALVALNEQVDLFLTPTAINEKNISPNKTLFIILRLKLKVQY